MQAHSVRFAALLAAILTFATPQAYGGECLPTGLASYSNLGRAIAKIRNGLSGELLAIWLLQSPDPTECRFVFRVDRLLTSGSIMSMVFDARTLDAVTMDDARGWSEYGGSGQGGEAGGSGDSGGASGDDDDDKSAENSEDNSGSGSSSSGSGSSGSSDSSGSGSDDSGGSGSDDSGSGSSGSGSDDSGSGSSGSGSDDSGSGDSGSGGSGSGKDD